ncbi:MAG: DUF2961 domain-containing protein [Planctomycetes bacterium]|nr:DUF2961 domain-containing protein [Planctomycetota bacterium]
MRRRHFAAFLLAASAPLAAQSTELSYPDLLRRLTNVDWLWQPPSAGERCLQFSSYDRRSDRGPSDQDAWYANDDRGNYLRVEVRDGKKEHVMVDVDGPGVLTRLWSANPAGVLWFDIDGERVWTVDFQALTSGKVAPVGEPLAGVHGRGWNCYLPIPFQKHLRIAAEKGDFYYQCNVTRCGDGVTVPSFRPELLQQFASEITACAQQLDAPAGALPGPVSPSRVVVGKGQLVREIEIRVRCPETVDLGGALRNLVLRVSTPGETLVDVPLLDFFVTGPEGKAWRSARLAVERHQLDVNGWRGTELRLRCRWPMPLPDGGSLELLADGDLHDVPQPTWSVVTERLPAGASPLLFRAAFHLTKGLSTRPFRDFLVLDASGGAGRFVGCSLLVQNPVRAWWGEGDEKLHVDGEAFPSTFGTGTEDYFGYAWCDNHEFHSAMHSQPQCDGPANRGFAAVHRTQLLDCVPFQRSFRFDMEVWHWADCKVDYATVAYWYGAAGASSGLPPTPPPAERTLDRLPPVQVFVAEQALEGESLPVLAVSGGQHEVQDMSFCEGRFSRDAQCWWKHGKPGDTLVLGVPIEAAGEYRVTAAFCMANDYGVVQVALGETKLGEPFDGYAPAVGSSGAQKLGNVTLAAGQARLTLTIVGKNERAKPAHMVGLDYLRLEKVR